MSCGSKKKEPRYAFSFRLLWPCIMNIGWRERNQQHAANLMFIIKLLSKLVSGIIMPISRRTRMCTAAYGVLNWLCWLWLCGAGTRAVCTVKVTVRLSWLSRTVTFTVHTARVSAPHNRSQHSEFRTPYAAMHILFLLMMGIMMPETCLDRSLIINIRLAASCWFLSLHPMPFLFLSKVPVWLSLPWSLACLAMFCEGFKYWISLKSDKLLSCS